MRKFTVKGCDGLELHGLAWDQVEKPLAIVQVSHGMAEHIGRYDRLAQYLNQEGFIVAGHDHRGHGATAQSPHELGHLGDQDGWNRLVDDLRQVSESLLSTYADLPLVVFGHSMGSFALRHYLTRYGADLAGVVLSGTGHNPPLLNILAAGIARGEVRRHGPRHRSVLMDKLSFGSFNKAFAPNRTPFDWLSRDPIEVDRYLADTLCGQVCTAQFFDDFVRGIQELGRMSQLRRIPKHLPILFMSGLDDPLCKQGRAIRKVAARLVAAGVKKPVVRIYKDARHELINETNHSEVYQDLAGWIRQILNARS